MNTNTAGGEQRLMPVAAQLGDIDKLYALARDKNPESRTELSYNIGSILEEELSPRESELVADVLIKLMRQAEKDLRHAIAEQISALDNVPLRLVLQLANDEIEIAKPVLTRSSVLSDMDLMYIIKSKSAEYWRAIAARERMGDDVIDTLADTGDIDTALILAENTNITLTDHALTALSDIAQTSEVLALPLLRRTEISSEVATRLYEYVGAEIKSFITRNYSIAPDDVSNIVDNTVQECANPGTAKDFMPDGYMITAAEKFKAKNMLNIRLMLNTLRRGHMRSFIAQLSVFTGLPVKTAGEIVQQPNGQGLAIVSRAYDIEKEDFLSLFMLSNKIWNHGVAVHISEIKVAAKYFDRATPEIARKILDGEV